MSYFIAKAIHIIFVVSYFAGIFYLIRLFIYHTETLTRDEEPKRSILHKQYMFMEERLWNIITLPAFIIMVLSGAYLLYVMPMFLQQGWLHIKLFFVFGLVAYHIWSWYLLKKLRKEETPYTSLQLRMGNEVATLILFAVVFAVILKDIFIENWYWSLISFVLMGVFIMLVVKIVNRSKKIK